MGKWVTAVEVTLRGQSLSALRHLSHFLTRCAEHERRRLLARYLSHLIINIMWSLDNVTARHYLQLVVSHLHVVQLRDRSLEIATRIIFTSTSAKQTACHWIVPRVLVKTKWWPENRPNAAATKFLIIFWANVIDDVAVSLRKSKIWI